MLLLVPAESAGFFDLSAFHLLALALMGGVLACLVLLIGRARTLEDRLDRLDSLDEIPKGLRALIESTKELDLRRLEHLLLDLRNEHKRLREQLMQLVESPRAGSVEGASNTSAPGERPAPAVAPLSERVMNRLLALGFERIHLITTAAELEELTGGDGDVLVEARRDGAICKGRVKIHAGAISEVDVRSSHDMFP
ncbi:MAG: hypothetical protein H6831_07540 [Planctomycetes bacterium]|nr:hypothetical protein [Planctomycetota bacterium]